LQHKHVTSSFSSMLCGPVLSTWSLTRKTAFSAILVKHTASAWWIQEVGGTLSATFLWDNGLTAQPDLIISNHEWPNLWVVARLLIVTVATSWVIQVHITRPTKLLWFQLSSKEKSARNSFPNILTMFLWFQPSTKVKSARKSFPNILKIKCYFIFKYNN